MSPPLTHYPRGHLTLTGLSSIHHPFEKKKKCFFNLLGFARYSLLHTGSRGIEVPNEGSDAGPLHWECGVLVTGPPGKSPSTTFLSVQFSSVAQSCPTLFDPMNRSMPGLPVHHQLRDSLRLTSIESVMPSSHLILCHPLLVLLPIPPSIRVFSNESTLRIRWPKYWSFSFSIIPSKQIPGLIFFRMDWLHLLAVQGTLKSLLQHHSSKAPILLAIHTYKLICCLCIHTYKMV